MTGQDRKEKFSRFLIKSVKSAKAFTFLSEKTVSNYVGSLNTMVLKYLQVNHSDLNDIFEVSSFEEAFAYFNELRDNAEFVEKETNDWGNLYSNAMFQYCCFLNAYEVFHDTNLVSNSFDQPLQQIYYGAPGTGKSHTINETTKNSPKENVFRTTFHPDSDYSTFIGCYKPKMVKAPIRDGSGHEITNACDEEKKRISYEFEPQSFLKAYVRAYETSEPVYLVIEEINRGNCAQILETCSNCSTGTKTANQTTA